MKVNTDDAIGMVISVDIISAKGSLVLPKGITVNESLAKALLRQGINEIEAESVISEPVIQANEIDDAYHEHVNLLFLRHRGPFMKEFQAWLLKK